ncbi:hypothetical protein [Pararobbsia alpina]|uniref:Uncharacterized protein n=1 Tax=Pararobbsia alpina TaxID=621374 RepID=A0A6S7B9R3_9BURK|nr:hypothetical protein [Pararobbsia alpina]CAB3781812.1 hypothetical protein LMG28138_01346 [Pararobbsia alpina]
MKRLKCKSRLPVLPACFVCAVLAAAWLVPGSALAQSAGLGQSRNSGISGSSPHRMGSSSAMELSSQGSRFGGSTGMSGGGSGNASNSIGLRGLGGSSAGAGLGMAGGTGSHASSSLAGTSSGMPGSRQTKPKFKLKPASNDTAGSSSTHSQYAYDYGAADLGRDASSIYKSRDEVAPTDDYQFGATDTR